MYLIWLTSCLASRPGAGCAVQATATPTSLSCRATRQGHSRPGLFFALHARSPFVNALDRWRACTPTCMAARMCSFKAGSPAVKGLPRLQVVEAMRRGLSPQAAAEEAVRRIARRVPTYVGAVVAVSKDGRHGAAAHGWQFSYSVVSAASGGRVETVAVEPLGMAGAGSAGQAAISTEPGT